MFDSALRSAVAVVASRGVAFSLQARSQGEPLTLRRRVRGRGAARSLGRAGALLPDGGVGGEVFTTSIVSFLNAYNALLVGRLILTWFPNPPQVSVSLSHQRFWRGW